MIIVSVILFLVLAFEIGFSIYCIKTNKLHKRLLSWVRVGALGAFVLLALVGVIEMSFRWVGFAILLGVWAIIATICLLANREGKHPYSPVRVILHALFACVMSVAMLFPAMLFPQYAQPALTGSHKITSTSATYVDESRVETFKNDGSNRELNLTFWFPSDAAQGEKYPLVVYSHGSFGLGMSNTSSYRELASNGYVVCAIDHPYHSFGTVDDKGELAIVNTDFMNEAMQIQSEGVHDEETYQTVQGWLTLRVDDMNFVLDTILANAASQDAALPYSLVDAEHIGLFGHSLGGASSVELGRERGDVDAVIALDGTMLGEYIGFENGMEIVDKTTPYPIPVLDMHAVASQEEFEQTFAENAETYANFYVDNHAADAHCVYFAGATHMSFTDLTMFSPTLAATLSGPCALDAEETLNSMNHLILTYFNTYLKGEGSFTAEGRMN